MLEEGQKQDLINMLTEKYPGQNVKYLEESNVNPIMGGEFLLKCIIAMFLASLFLVIYVAIRFRKIGGASAGVMAVIALLHDIIMSYFVFVVLRMPLDDNFIAVALTILGFSLNATIVIYDRIRENKRIMGPKVSIAEITNTSINQTLTRNINTTICVVVAILVICVVAIATGITSILSFAIPMLVGTISGAYTSICIAPTLWVWWIQKTKSPAKVKGK